MKHLLIFLCLLAWGYADGMAQQSQVARKRQPRKINPEEPMIHDPVMIKQGDTFYLFSTGFGISVMSSKDMHSWQMEKSVFAEPPEWAVKIIPDFKGHIWAPDVIYHQGQYHIFYSCSAFGKNTSAIGHATTPTLDVSDPAFKWTDHGKLIQSVPNRDRWNAIDSNVIVDEEGTPWLNFGSFWDGIKMVKLTKDMMNVAQPEEWYSLCNRKHSPHLKDAEPGDGAVEAPFIRKHGGYYYLFVSFDYCCQGLKSTYKIGVGRSKQVTGPYLDKEGVSLAQGGGSIVLQGNENWAGVGHCAAYSFEGKDYLIAHGYYIPEDGVSKLVVREITWVNDWPTVEGLD